MGLAMLVGCLGRGQADLLQARLREQQQRLTSAQSELKSAEQQLAHARKEADALRTQLAESGRPGLLPEQSDLLVRVANIRINPMLTAGVDKDEVAGDDALVVQFAPYDSDGELVKLPGKIEIVAVDPGQPEAQQTIARWEFRADVSRKHWVRGFLGAGYQFTLPWPEPPKQSELIVHVRLTAPDGRAFSANQIIKINPPVIAAGRSTTARRAALETPLPSREAPAAAFQRKPLHESTNWTEETMPVRR